MRFLPTSARRFFGLVSTPATATAATALLLLASLPGAAQTVVLAADHTAHTGHLQAHLTLKPLEIVDLGGGRPTGFLLQAHNVGQRRCVALFERTAAGDTISRGLLGPGATVTLTLAPGSAAFVQNPPKRRELRNSLLGRAVFEFEVINGTDEDLQKQFVHQLTSR